MLDRSLVLCGLLTIAAFSMSGRACAKPKSTTFDKLIENSATVAVAKFADEKPDRNKTGVSLELLRVLKGDTKPGKYFIPFEDLPDFNNAGDTFVAFLDARKVWRFVAHPLNGKKLEQDLLQLDGFYDDNAYHISPAVVTLAQLQGYLQHKKLTYRFRGDVFFPVPKKVAWEAGTLRIKGTYDALKKIATVDGLPDLKGIAGQPMVDIHTRGKQDRPFIDLVYSRRTSRALTLTGKVDGVDPATGDILVRFALQAPEVLTQRAFEEYLAVPESHGPYYKFKLACKPIKGNIFPEVLYLSELKSTGRYFQDAVLEGYGKATWESDGRSSDGKVLRIDMKTDAGAALTLAFNVEAGPPDDGAFHWTFQSVLPYSIYRTTTALGSVEVGGRAVATFTATLDSVCSNRGP